MMLGSSSGGGEGAAVIAVTLSKKIKAEQKRQKWQNTINEYPMSDLADPPIDEYIICTSIDGKLGQFCGFNF